MTFYLPKMLYFRVLTICASLCRKCRGWLFTLLTVGAALPGHAQDYIDLGSLGYYFSPGNSFREAEGEGDVEEWRLNLLLPAPLKHGDVFVMGVNAHQLRILKRGLEVPEANDNLQSLLVRIGYIKQLNENWSATLMAVPQFNGEWGDIDAGETQIGGLVMLNWKKSDTRQYKFGFFANPHLFGTFLLPLVGLDWRLGERWQLFGTLPFTATASYKASEKLRAGFDFAANIVTYRYGNSDYLEKATNELSVFMDVQTIGNLVLRLQGGYSIGREYKRYLKGDRSPLVISAFDFGDRQFINQNLGDGLVLRASLIFRLPRPE